jgi:hypothetical protein
LPVAVGGNIYLFFSQRSTVRSTQGKKRIKEKEKEKRLGKTQNQPSNQNTIESRRHQRANREAGRGASARNGWLAFLVWFFGSQAQPPLFPSLGLVFSSQVSAST